MLASPLPLLLLSLFTPLIRSCSLHLFPFIYCSPPLCSSSCPPYLFTPIIFFSISNRLPPFLFSLTSFLLFFLRFFPLLPISPCSPRLTSSLYLPLIPYFISPNFTSWPGQECCRSVTNPHWIPSVWVAVQMSSDQPRQPAATLLPFHWRSMTAIKVTRVCTGGLHMYMCMYSKYADLPQ